MSLMSCKILLTKSTLHPLITVKTSKQKFTQLNLFGTHTPRLLNFDLNLFQESLGYFQADE